MKTETYRRIERTAQEVFQNYDLENCSKAEIANIISRLVYNRYGINCASDASNAGNYLAEILGA